MTINLPNIRLLVLRVEAVSQDVEQRVLIIGQKTNSGSAATGSLLEDAPVSNVSINALFGARSALSALRCARSSRFGSKAVCSLSPTVHDANGGSASCADCRKEKNVSLASTFA